MNILISILVVLAILYVAVGVFIVGGMSLSGMGTKPTVMEFVKSALTWYKYFV
jgi:hypothetical protein